jgi:hypothetical protein
VLYTISPVAGDVIDVAGVAILGTSTPWLVLCTSSMALATAAVPVVFIAVPCALAPIALSDKTATRVRKYSVFLIFLWLSYLKLDGIMCHLRCSDNSML